MTDPNLDLDELRAERDQLKVERDRWRGVVDTQRAEINGLIERSEKLTARADKLEALGAELTAQVEEMEMSPLDLTQQQRAKALTLAREVVEETGSASMLHKSGSSKVSLAGVVSTAHFIISGDRDYVVTEGEFIERQHDGRRRGEVLPPESQARPVYTDAGYSYAETGGPAPHSDLDQPEVDDDQ